MLNILFTLNFSSLHQFSIHNYLGIVKIREQVHFIVAEIQTSHRAFCFDI